MDAHGRFNRRQPGGNSVEMTLSGKCFFHFTGKSIVQEDIQWDQRGPVNSLTIQAAAGANRTVRPAARAGRAESRKRQTNARAASRTCPSKKSPWRSTSQITKAFHRSKQKSKSEKNS